mgnify:CR=1 FL=1
MAGRMVGLQPSERHDRQAVANLPEVRGRTVKFDHSRTGLAVDDIGLEALAVAHVADKDAFVRQQPHALGKIAGNGEAAFVIERGTRYDGTVNLRF